jgi:hypothetical protein
MQFRCVAIASDIGLHEEGVSTIEFAASSDPPLRVELRDERGRGRLEMYCEVVADIEPKPKIVGAFESLAAGRLPAGSTPADKWSKPLAQLDPSGEIRGPLRSVPMDYMPPAFQDFVARIQRDLPRAGNRAMELLRWRSGELGPQRPFTSGWDVTWSFGDGEWRDFPGSTGLALDYTRLLRITRNAYEDLQRLFAEDHTEPFAYEGLREAWALRGANPRTSLLIAITALEVAVKQYIADRVEPATWLVNNSPSPDVIRLLREYLPTLEPPLGALSGASKLDVIPADLLELLRKRRDQRNEVIHQPEAHVNPKRRVTSERASSAVLAVHQVLRRFDIADGHAWARDYLREPPYAAPPGGYLRVR